jgi:predicted TIM-barrel fold metal-dependent hydrolase
MKTRNKIDVHHHIFPQEYVDTLKEVGVEKSLGRKLPKWNARTSLKKMKENGVQKAMVSITAPGVYIPEAASKEGFPEELARIANKSIAKLIKEYPENFGGFATIPMLNQAAAIDELNYALDELKLDGVCLFTNYNGKYLGHQDFEEIFKEFNRRKVVVFLHPADPGEEFDNTLGIPNGLIEVTFDTTRAVTNLMYNGVLDRHQNIKYILSHGGGTIPYIAWRLASIEYGQKDKRTPVARALYDFLVKKEPTTGLNHLRNMYYDTANVSGTYALKALQSFVGKDHIVYGTDLCISKLAPIITKNLTVDGDFDEESFNKMAYGNCLNLFPSLKEHYS